MERGDLITDIRRTKQRYAYLCYRFQAARFRWARLFAVFQASLRRFYVAAPHLDPQRLPVCSMAAGPDGVPRLVRRDRIEGAGDRAFLRCWTEASSGTMVLHAEGEADIQTSPMLGDAIAASYRAGPRVIVDLGGLRYLDGSGVRVMEEAAREHPVRFVVVASTRAIYRVFEILELTQVLPVVHSLEAAREYFGLP